MASLAPAGAPVGSRARSRAALGPTVWKETHQLASRVAEMKDDIIGAVARGRPEDIKHFQDLCEQNPRTALALLNHAGLLTAVLLEEHPAADIYRAASRLRGSV